jgi:hypothetical protein
MWFKSKGMKLENIMLSKVSLAQKDKGHIFSLNTWKIEPNYKHIHKNKHDHIQIHM